jgi:hypothetical protein
MEPSFTISPEIIKHSLQDIEAKNLRTILDRPNVQRYSNPPSSSLAATTTPATNIDAESDLSASAAVLPEIQRPSLLGTAECLRDIELILCPFLMCDAASTRVGYGVGSMTALFSAYKLLGRRWG